MICDEIVKALSNYTNINRNNIKIPKQDVNGAPRRAAAESKRPPDGVAANTRETFFDKQLFE